MPYIHRSLERKFLKMSGAFKAVMVTGASEKSRGRHAPPGHGKGASPCGLLPEPAALPGHEQSTVQAPTEGQSNKTLNSSTLARP